MNMKTPSSLILLCEDNQTSDRFQNPQDISHPETLKYVCLRDIGCQALLSALYLCPRINTLGRISANS